MVSLPRLADNRWLFDALLNRKFYFGISTETLEEYPEIIGNFFTPEVGQNVVNMLLDRPNALRITLYYTWNLVEIDVDDNKFVDCVIGCGADYIITEDRHFNSLTGVVFPKASVVGFAECRHILDDKSEMTQL